MISYPYSNISTGPKLAIKNSLNTQILSSNQAQAAEMRRTIQSLLQSMQENMKGAAQYLSKNEFPAGVSYRTLPYVFEVDC